MSVDPVVGLVGVGAALLLGVLLSRGLLGDAAIWLAGADRSLLRQWSVDRAYFVGLGMSLLLAAAIAGLALGTGTAVAFHLPALSPVSIGLGVVYAILILGLDRWLVSDPTFGFPRHADAGASIGALWLRHAVVELLKIAPRAVIVYFASSLFASLMLLIVFQPEITEQMKAMQVHDNAVFTQQVKAETDRRTNDARAAIEKAGQEKKTVLDSFNAGTAAIDQARQARDAEIKAAEDRGVRCYQRAYTYVWYDAQGRQRTSTGYQDVCPQEIQDIQTNYSQQVARFPQTQADVSSQLAAIDNKYKIAELQRYVNSGAQEAIQKEWAGQRPQAKDGLLARMGALDMLTTPPKGTCSPTTADPSLNLACTSRYSARAAGMQSDLRYWILALEVTPIVMKFVMSLLPRRGYASQMAARDEEAKTDAWLRMDGQRIKHRLAVEKLLRDERAAMNTLALIDDEQGKEIARVRLLWRLRALREQLAPHAIAGSVRAFVTTMHKKYPDLHTLRDPESNGHRSEDVPSHEAFGPGRRVIDNEDAL